MEKIITNKYKNDNGLRGILSYFVLFYTLKACFDKFFCLLKNWKKLKASQGFLAGFCIQIANIIYTDIYPYVEGVFIFTEDQLLV